MIYRHEKHRDQYGTGNYSEVMGETFEKEIPEERAKDFIALWEGIGAKYYETSKRRVWWIQDDARTVSLYILIK